MTQENTSPLTFKQFQDMNVKRSEELFNMPIDSWSPMEWACALNGEIGELNDAYLRSLSDRSLQTINEVAGEIADIFTYGTLFAKAANVFWAGDIYICNEEKAPLATKVSILSAHGQGLCEVTKKITRDGKNNARLLRQTAHLSGIFAACKDMAQTLKIDLEAACLEKFEIVSQHQKKKLEGAV